jgi:hypothetical protein
MILALCEYLALVTSHFPQPTEMSLSLLATLLAYDYKLSLADS